MSQSIIQVRRAIVDDLENLRSLWEANHIPAADLERRLTEFQVAQGVDGTLLGAIGMQILGRQGLLHSEAFSDFGQAETLRQQLWARLQSVATNHGLARIWTRETAPFWKQNGFQPPDEDTLKKLPGAWVAEPNGWLTLRLRDEEALEISLDKEFARFKEESKRQAKRALDPGRALKFLATVMAIIFAAGILIILIYMLRNYPRMMGR